MTSDTETANAEVAADTVAAASVGAPAHAAEDVTEDAAASGTQPEPWAQEHLHMPDPTPWPMVLALGLTLMGAGLLVEPFLISGAAVAAVGLACFVIGLAKLIREDIRLLERSES